MPNVFDPYSDRYALRAAGMTGSEIRALFSVLERPEIISLAGGNTDTDIIAHRVVDLVGQVIADDSKGALGYGPAGGHIRLREQLVGLMAGQGIECRPDQILITTGAQQALEFMAKVFCEPGDLVLTEAPTYVGALGAFASFQAEMRSVDTDADGIVPEALESTLESIAAEGRRVKFLYLVPTFQNPSGYTLSAARRPRVIDICHRHDVLIVEDDPYAQIRFEGDPVPPLRALTDEGIIYLGTLSKVFSPGIRTGWILAPESVRDRLVLAKEAADLCSSPFTQLLAATYLASPYVEEDLAMVRKIYKEKRDTMLDAIDVHLPAGVRVSEPQGGLFLWATFPEGMDTKSMLSRALQGGVAYVPGTGFYPRKQDGLTSMRLNFSYPSIAEIDEGIRRLGVVIAQHGDGGLASDLEL